MYLKLPRVTVRVTFLFAAALALAANTGRAEAVGTVFVSALLHECAHLALLLSYGEKDLTLLLLPGGARIENAALQALPYRKLLVCALAGPAVNLLLAGALYLCFLRSHGAFFLQAAEVNLLLGGCNLLPVSFLDGGRALESLVCLKRKSPVPLRVRRLTDICTVLLLAAASVRLWLTGRDAVFFGLFAAYCGVMVCRREKR